MLFKACVFKNVLLAKIKDHITKMHLFFKMDSFIFRDCFLTFAGRSKNLCPGAHFRIFGKLKCVPETILRIREIPFCGKPSVVAIFLLPTQAVAIFSMAKNSSANRTILVARLIGGFLSSC